MTVGAPAEACLTVTREVQVRDDTRAMGLDTPAETISRCTAVKAPAEPRYDEGSGRGANSSAPVGM
jgi:hypothetical protein